jgi:predicted alpha-1,6-mannanase (GH76 family)
MRFGVSGWDQRVDVPSPGGVFWVEQGRGLGKTNHDRNTVSNAPNAELGLHLAELGGGAPPAPGAEEMYAWVVATLDASHGGEEAGTGLFWDKIRGDGTIDEMLWSYNQGSMVGAAVLLARRGGPAGARYLAGAEAIARKALAHYTPDRLARQPAAFNAIFFRNLLLLHAATADGELRAEILAATRAYADWAWRERRDGHDRFRFSGGEGLLDQSAMVQVLALLAWDPGDYGRLA